MLRVVWYGTLGVLVCTSLGILFFLRSLYSTFNSVQACILSITSFSSVHDRLEFRFDTPTSVASVLFFTPFLFVCNTRLGSAAAIVVVFWEVFIDQKQRETPVCTHVHSVCGVWRTWRAWRVRSAEAEVPCVRHVRHSLRADLTLCRLSRPVYPCLPNSILTRPADRTSLTRGFLTFCGFIWLGVCESYAQHHTANVKTKMFKQRVRDPLLN